MDCRDRVFLVGHAVGVQLYRCNTAAGTYSWGLTADYSFWKAT